jgi:hypothetical protein
MNGVFSYDASRNGTLIYLRSHGDGEKLVVNRRGDIVDTLHHRGAWNNAVSRSGTMVALGGPDRLWLYDLARKSPRPITKSFGSYPAWSPGDTAIAYLVLEGSQKGARGSGCEVRVRRLRDDVDTSLASAPSARCLVPTDWSRDGRYLLAMEFVQNLSLGRGLWAFDWREKKWTQLLKTETPVGEAMLSPDDRWVAYQSDETRTREVFVRPFMRAGEAVRVSADGGRSPRWRADGSELYFETPDGRIMAVPFTSAAASPVGTPHTLFNAPGFSRQIFFDGGGTSYDVDGKGERFIMRITPNSPEAVLVQNWNAHVGSGGGK